MPLCMCNCNCKNRNKYDYMCLTPSISKIIIIENNQYINKYIVNCSHFASCHLSKTTCKYNK